MATHFRRKRNQEEEESVFISMTDMTVSFLFIMLILLAFFASQFNPDEVVERSLYEHEVRKNQKLIKEITDLKKQNEELKKENERLKKMLSKEYVLANYLAGISSQKLSLMQSIKASIEKETGLKVEIDAQNGIIRFSGDDLFDSGQWQVYTGSTADQVAKAIGNVFDELLPCFSLGERSLFQNRCNTAFAVLEAIQIEGHTDDLNLSLSLRNRERMLDNYDLSARRSTEMFRAMTQRHLSHLVQYKNLKGQPILSFSGYGDMRPLVPNTDQKSRATNRRIDLRFIMATPNSVDQIDQIKSSLMLGRPPLEKRVVP
jgi:flagellar motor protein MotB